MNGAFFGIRALVIILLCVAGLGVSAALRFPIFDDEAHAIANASHPLAEILTSGLGEGRQFHPPLVEVVQHGWLSLTGTYRVALIRVPAMVFWLAALASLYWALSPIATRRERITAVAVTGLWPTHLILPFSATWYSLSALLSMIGFGALVRALAPSQVRRAALVGAVAATVALAYTVFAWPFVLLGEAAAVVVMLGMAPVRRARWALVVAVVALAVGVAPTMTALSARLGPMLAHQAGGGPFQSLGAAAGLLVGHSCPATPWSILPLLAAATGLGLGLARRDRRVIGLGLACAIALGSLVASNTLNDKRLLLGSVFVSAALGLAAAGRRGRVAVLLSCVAAIPAWLGWAGVTRLPWLFPRWQDPIQEIASVHVASSPRRLLVTDEPAIALTVALLDRERHLWDLPEGRAPDSPPRRWPPYGASFIIRALAEQQRAGLAPPDTIDIAVSARFAAIATASVAALPGQGWSVAQDRSLGDDPLVRFRHPGLDAARLRFVRFVRSERAP